MLLSSSSFFGKLYHMQLYYLRLSMRPILHLLSFVCFLRLEFSLILWRCKWYQLKHAIQFEFLKFSVIMIKKNKEKKMRILNAYNGSLPSLVNEQIQSFCALEFSRKENEQRWRQLKIAFFKMFIYISIDTHLNASNWNWFWTIFILTPNCPFCLLKIK